MPIIIKVCLNISKIEAEMYKGTYSKLKEVGLREGKREKEKLS